MLHHITPRIDQITTEQEEKEDRQLKAIQISDLVAHMFMHIQCIQFGRKVFLLKYIVT